MRHLIIGLALVARAASAQMQPAESFAGRLSPDARVALQRLVDSARAAGIPAAPLQNKIAEGALKGADERRIIAAVQSLIQRLADAQRILGPRSRDTDGYGLLGATASALQAGVAPGIIQSLVALDSTQRSDPRPLVGALVTVVDLIAKHIPASAAGMSVADLLRRRATEDELVAFRADIARDITAGATPDIALATRMRAYMQALDANRSIDRRPPGGRASPPGAL